MPSQDWITTSVRLAGFQKQNGRGERTGRVVLQYVLRSLFFIKDLIGEVLDKGFSSEITESAKPAVRDQRELESFMVARRKSRGSKSTRTRINLLGSLKDHTSTMLTKILEFHFTKDVV